jgi:alanyl aminopeptidase
VTLEPAGRNRVKLSQRRFVTVGTPDVAAPQWRIPVILRYPVKGALYTQRVWLDAPSKTVDLATSSMPKWILPNGGASGYYRWSVPAAMRDSLVLTARGRLTPRERIDLVGNLSAQLRAGLVTGDRYLALMTRLADDASPEVVRQAIESINDSRVSLSTESSERAWSAYVRSTLQPTVSRFGIAPRAGEPESVEMMRPVLLRFLGDAGRDSRVLAYADSVSRAYRRDPASVPASVAEQSVVIAAIQGDRALFDDYRKRFETTTVPLERPMYLQALGSFRDPALRHDALAYALAGPLRPHERLMIPTATALNQLGSEGRFSGVYSDETAQWMMDHFTELRAMLPPNFATRIMSLGGGCSEARRNELRAFFAAEENRVQGGENLFGRMVDSMDECAQLHARPLSNSCARFASTPSAVLKS